MIGKINRLEQMFISWEHTQNPEKEYDFESLKSSLYFIVEDCLHNNTQDYTEQEFVILLQNYCSAYAHKTEFRLNDAYLYKLLKKLNGYLGTIAEHHGIGKLFGTCLKTKSLKVLINDIIPTAVKEAYKSKQSLFVKDHGYENCKNQIDRLISLIQNPQFKKCYQNVYPGIKLDPIDLPSVIIQERYHTELEQLTHETTNISSYLVINTSSILEYLLQLQSNHHPILTGQIHLLVQAVSIEKYEQSCSLGEDKNLEHCIQLLMQLGAGIDCSEKQFDFLATTMLSVREFSIRIQLLSPL